MCVCARRAIHHHHSIHNALMILYSNLVLGSNHVFLCWNCIESIPNMPYWFLCVHSFLIGNILYIEEICRCCAHNILVFFSLSFFLCRLFHLCLALISLLLVLSLEFFVVVVLLLHIIFRCVLCWAVKCAMCAWYVCGCVCIYDKVWCFVCYKYNFVRM